ncbi:MAG: glycosyltransferase [Desulfomonile sp.]|nr:glycosyltransferase [Desulfomonile sp.]
MSLPAIVLVAWLAATFLLVLFTIAIGTVKVLWGRLARRSSTASTPTCKVEIVIPLRGVVPNQETILASFLEQDHPMCRVSFVVESESDPANTIVDRLCSRYDHARKLVSGLSSACAQKNHSLIAGVVALRPDTDIIVFCDSTNVVRGDWLSRFIAPIEAGEADVVTTFRSFKPEPESIAGVAQAIYASFLLLLITLQPKPWGGATAIRRATFDRLGVIDVWSRTVVDDLVLGNILESAGIAVCVDPDSVLISPVARQTVSGFLSYLDRQILFPKFTNPGIWLGGLIAHLNVTAAAVIASAAIVASVFRLASVWVGAAGLAYIVGLPLMSLAMRRVSATSVSVGKWLLALYPCIFLVAFIFLRSIVSKYIIWHGRAYRPGPGGVVQETTFQLD